jgi:DNA segregation ATPase FtsK/SpoIIIE-like protein
VTSADEARVASGIGGTGAEQLAGRGDFILVAGGQTVRFQAAYLAPNDYENFRERVRLRGALTKSSTRPAWLTRLTRIK